MFFEVHFFAKSHAKQSNLFETYSIFYNNAARGKKTKRNRQENLTNNKNRKNNKQQAVFTDTVKFHVQ